MIVAKRMLFDWLLAASVVMSVLYPAHTQEPSFDVVISSPTAAVSTEGTPVRVAVTIVNHSQERWNFAEPRCEPKAVTVRDDHETVLELRAEFREVGVRACGFGTLIFPSKSYRTELIISRWFDLSRPGRYFVQVAPTGVSDSNRRETEKSNVLEIQIVQRR